MQVVLIGAGNVATVLGRKFQKAGHTIAQVFARHPQQAQLLAKEMNADYCTSWTTVRKAADFYLVAISDNALEEVAEYLEVSDGLVAHTAGAISKEVLRGVSDHYGIFYPLQSLLKEMSSPSEFPIIIDGATRKTIATLKEIAHSISTQVYEYNDEKRLQLHLAAVFVNNFVNHLYVQAEKYCSEHRLDFKQLLPLLTETANRVQFYAPHTVQTGPAIRHDSVTIEKHLELLKNEPTLKKLYELLTKSIQANNQ
jgi:predicted short-subunit dehydrogenase-like oxidoreductase (DUF2520 family)